MRRKRFLEKIFQKIFAILALWYLFVPALCRDQRSEALPRLTTRVTSALRPYSTNQSCSHLFHILLHSSLLPPPSNHLLFPPSAICLLSASHPTQVSFLSTWSAPSDSSHSTALGPADQYTGHSPHAFCLFSIIHTHAYR